ncbi:hypothetical protein AD428_05560 [Achromobacter sp. DMS1]|uniref:DUF3303 family protein n=1 Tax=Achromobacter sp. DMS1 TaxID=1688405 RepID=UPI00069D4D1C|nr:DUF3303 family protein [Achromobacter sp. DMS1]KOF54602.1 hypothetical protein AD428_06055 [Achromobacter sp. DMS1]KOF54676.1 hypothetical protein AD428_05560 [Achromobacter sp. DMS1]
MLFLVISSPRPERPSSMRPGQKAYWDWLNGLEAAGVVRHVWNKVGRGAIVVLEVDSHEKLHVLLNQWAEHVPASFEVYAVTPKSFQETIARQGTNPLEL